jgi:hypothetical protein
VSRAAASVVTILLQFVADNGHAQAAWPTTLGSDTFGSFQTALERSNFRLILAEVAKQ